MSQCLWVFLLSACVPVVSKAQPELSLRLSSRYSIFCDYSLWFLPIVLFWKNGSLPWSSVTSKEKPGAKQLRKKINNVSLAAINTVPSDRLQRD